MLSLGNVLIVCTLFAQSPGCARTSYPAPLLASQQACANLMTACGEAAKLGTPCPAIPQCPMKATIKTKYEGMVRDLGIGFHTQGDGH